MSHTDNHGVHHRKTPVDRGGGKYKVPKEIAQPASWAPAS